MKARIRIKNTFTQYNNAKFASSTTPSMPDDDVEMYAEIYGWIKPNDKSKISEQL